MFGFIGSFLKFIFNNLFKVALIVITFLIIRYLDNHFGIIKNIRESVITSIQFIKSILGKRRSNLI